MTFWQFIQAHYLAIAVGGWFLFTCCVNALPPAGQPFVFGTWLIGTLKEIAQQAPTKFSALSTTEQTTGQAPQKVTTVTHVEETEQK